MGIYFRSFCLMIIFCLTGIQSFSQIEKPEYVPPTSRILFIFDGSQSMLGTWKSDRKINIARQTLIKIIDSLEQVNNVEMALRIYGHQSPVPPQDCDDTRLEVPFSKGNAHKIRQELRYINPKGTTPIARSLELGAKDFPDDCPDCRNVIILITDGIEACEGDPCAMSHALQKKGIVLKPFVIGIGIDEGFHDTFDCIGHYYNADKEEKLGEVMDAVISQVLNSTTAQINLLDIHGYPTETDVNMTLYDHRSGKALYNYMHTMNHRGNPDTLVLDHLPVYDLRVHTIPPVDVDSFKVYPNKHTTIAADCPQGELIVNVDGGRQYRGLQYIVRQDGQMKTLNIQEVNRKEKYLVGLYDLEIPILPRMYIDSVRIDQSTLTTITIPRPGLLNLMKGVSGYGSLYVRGGKLKEEWIYNLDPESKNETLVLQPGDYRVVFRSQNAKHVLYTVNKTFTIKPGASVTVQLY